MDFRRTFDILSYQKAKFKQKIALAGRMEKQWLRFSTDDCLKEIDQVSAGLLNIGLKQGDKVAIITYIGSPQWNILDFGIQQIGLISVPIHATSSAAEIAFILRDAACKCCFVSTEEIAKKVLTNQDDLPLLTYTYSFKKIPNIPIPQYDDLLETPTAEQLETFQVFKAAIHEEDLATIIYTSGTSGEPKGVLLSHKNIVSNIKSIIPLIPVNCDKRALSFLPLSHIFERMVTYTYIAVGASVYYSERIESIVDDMKTIKPHYFASVPRLLEKLYEGILEDIENRNTISKSIILWAIRLGKKYGGKWRLSPWRWLQLKIADLLVYRKWRQAIGGRIEGIVVGAAALQPALGQLFSAAGIEVREGYGLTETSPVVAFNRFEPGGVHFGTVGIPVPGVEVRIHEPDEEGQGEIWVKGPNVMMGYHNLPELTAQIITEDGWLRTGDIGKFVYKRFLKITDRAKDIFKMSSGKFIAPQHIENSLKVSPFIEQCLVVGLNRPYLVAVVLPNFSKLKKWCDKHQIHWTAPQFMVLNPKVQRLINKEVEKFTEALPRAEQIRKTLLVFKEWTIEGGEITPTLKLRRSAIYKQYQKELEKLYAK